VSTCHRRKAGRKRCRVGMMSLATSCDITRHHAIGSGSGSGAGGVRRHSPEGVAEEGRGGGSGSGRQAGVGSGSGRRVGVGSVRGSPYSYRPLLVDLNLPHINKLLSQLPQIPLPSQPQSQLSACGVTAH